MQITQHFCTYNYAGQECDWDDYEFGKGEENSGYMPTENVCQVTAGAPPQCPNYELCVNQLVDDDSGDDDGYNVIVKGLGRLYMLDELMDYMDD
jgi:hypothetical protein